MGIEVKNISKSFHRRKVLENIDFKIGDSELIALIGPSGSGKTTLLRIIAGLEFADSGSIFLDGADAQSLSVRERKLGFVFQNYVLFKHMSVFDNVAFGLKVQSFQSRLSREEIRKKVTKLLKLVHLEKFHSYYPHQLSGGQQQRVALARALAIDPKVLLLDEPFGALDTKVRKELGLWLRRLHNEIEISSVFVTHDQEEAMEIADHVGVIDKGKIIQFGPPDEILNQPVNHFVYDFIGNHNEFTGWIDENNRVHLLEEDAIQEKEKPKNKKIINLYSRPYEMQVTKLDEEGSISVNLVHFNIMGSLVKMDLKRKNGDLLEIELPKSEFDSLQIKKGEKLFVRPLKFNIFDSL